MPVVGFAALIGLRPKGGSCGFAAIGVLSPKLSSADSQVIRVSVMRHLRGAMARQLKYIELCTGTNHSGPAWIAYVEKSKTGRMIYFNGRALIASRGSAGSHLDIESHDEYWVSGVKRKGSNRHWAGSGRVSVESTAVEELLELLGADELDRSLYDVVDPLPMTDRERIRLLQNRTLDEIYAELDLDDDAA